MESIICPTTAKIGWYFNIIVFDFPFFPEFIVQRVEKKVYNERIESNFRSP